MEDLDLYPDIDDYLDKTDNSLSITVTGLEDIICKVRAYTGLSYREASTVLKGFLNVTRNLMLRGEKVRWSGVGTFLVSSPKVTNNKFKIFASFVADKTLCKRLNSEEGDQQNSEDS